MALEKVERILAHVAEAQNIANYELIPDEDVIKGDGLLSEFYTGEVKNKDTGEVLKTYIKLPPKYELNFKSDVYVNENHFYEKIVPELLKFQRDKGVKAPFDNVPRFYCGGNELENEYVVLENLRVQNYVLHDKGKFIEEALLKVIFELYGKFHALTFAFKSQNPEQYKALLEPVTDAMLQLANMVPVQQGIQQILKQACEDINEADAGKVRPYVENLGEIFVKSTTYKGDYSSLIHGDCWSNNMLFKYKADGALENIKLLDFQLLRESSPIHDLSYFFYCGASKKDFDRLDYYLDIYYQSFSAFCRELGSDAETLFPKEALKKEWRQNSVWGIFMSFNVWQFKLMERQAIKNIGDSSQQKFEDVVQKIWRSEVFRNVIRDIVLHAVEYNIF